MMPNNNFHMIHGSCEKHETTWTVIHPKTLELRLPGCPVCADEKRLGAGAQPPSTPLEIALSAIMRKHGYAITTEQAWGLIADLAGKENQ